MSAQGAGRCQRRRNNEQLTQLAQGNSCTASRQASSAQLTYV